MRRAKRPPSFVFAGLKMKSEHTNNDQFDYQSLNFEELDHVMQARRRKLDQILELGINPFPYRFNRSHTVKKALDNFEQLEKTEERISLAGRIVSLRLMGKAAFAHVLDEDHPIQIYLKRDILGDQLWKLFKLLDIGDIIGVEGKLFVTRTGERTLEAASLTLLSKNLRPLPAIKEKEGQVWHRWADKEERYRQRSIDLIVNKESRLVFKRRSDIIREIRDFFDNEKQFIE